jgi:hypothetical protein
VPDFCTCGAQLPPDARFCHKCGKPQRDEPVLVEEPAPPPPPPLVPAVQSPPIGFRNGRAVRVALPLGIVTFLLSAVSGVFALVWLVACGFFAVFLYRRGTGQKLSVISGAHLGWIAGLFVFLIALVLVVVAAFAFTQPEMVAAMRAQMRALARSEAEVEQIIELFRRPSAIAAQVVTAFFVFTLLPAFGGAMGAKLLDRD